MKIAVFSDIHSCHSKMAAVFLDMEKYQIDKFICLGDIIGYGDQPEETIKLLMGKNVVSVRGNHELAMFDRQYLECFPKAIKQPLLNNIVMLSTKSCSLPLITCSLAANFSCATLIAEPISLPKPLYCLNVFLKST